MGMFKRILRQTSHKLLAKLGAQRNSHRLVLNSHSTTATGQLAHHTSTKNRVSRKITRRIKKRGGGDSAVSEALLLAAKNYLPPVQFHHVHGPNVQLSPNKFVARRTLSFCQALVFSNRVILPNERVYIKVLEIAKGWSGTIRFGFTSVDPATLRYQMPKHACPDMTNAGHTWARALADEVVRRNSVIHFSYNTNGYIHYGINNQDCGVFNANVKTSQHLWFIVDIYGLTAAVELIDPRVHNNNYTSELNFSRMDDELRNDSRGTMHKSTGAMNELVGSAFGVRSKKKRSRKALRNSGLLYGQWSTENLMLSPHQLRGFESNRGPVLPNLSSIILPPAQQNIYSPMPSIAAANRPAPPLRNESHDYYQIITNRHPSNLVESTQLSSNQTSTLPLTNRSSHENSIEPNLSTTSSSSRSGFENGEEEICEQFDSFQISEDSARRQLAIKSPKSTITSSLPVAATRRKQTNNLVQTNLKRAEASKDYQTKMSHLGSGANKVPNSASKSSNSPSNLKSKARHSIKAPKTASSRDINNNSPQSKDCPICFERPINCVLYQCGHMCTCYECGVKQWKTQSRTCPICRTVIKDVIKTYMS